jgi:hypothetical protein
MSAVVALAGVGDSPLRNTHWFDYSLCSGAVPKGWPGDGAGARRTCLLSSKTKHTLSTGPTAEFT